MLGAAIVVAIAAVATVGWASREKDEVDYVCTLVGCTTGVGFDFHAMNKRLFRESELEFCADETCRSFSVPACGRRYCPRHPDRPEGADFYAIEVRGLKSKDEVVASMRIVREGRTLFFDSEPADVNRFEPNGRRCGPTCFVASVRYDRKTDRLVEAG